MKNLLNPLSNNSLPWTINKKLSPFKGNTNLKYNVKILSLKLYAYEILFLVQ
jgi:hypothetical protein